MRSFSVDPYSRENFALMYKIVGELINRHHIKDRLHLLSYINKDRGYYLVYLSQDPANPLSSSFGYFNASLGNFRCQYNNEIFYYYYEYKNGKSIAEIVNKIEEMIRLPFDDSTEEHEANVYVLSVKVLVELIDLIAHMEEGLAVENEICPYFGPYSKTPDSRLWYDLKRVLEPHGIDISTRCTYDYYVVGIGTPLGPVYKPLAYFANSGYVYIVDQDPIYLPEFYEVYRDHRVTAQKIIEQLTALKPVTE